MRAIKGLAPGQPVKTTVRTPSPRPCHLPAHWQAGFSRFAQTLNQQEQHAAGHQGDDQAIVTSDADQHAADYRPGNAAGGPEKAEQGVNHNQLLPIEGFPARTSDRV